MGAVMPLDPDLRLFGEPSAPDVAEETAVRALSEHPVPGGGRLTLEQWLSSVWEGLVAAGDAACPVCGGGMERRLGEGRCGRCGTRLA
jgi:hypothetical protein